MIKLLSIRNLLLIDEIDLSLDKGLCVLTGETGAGKSMILDSLNLITGERAKPGLRPENGKVLSVSALVDVGRFIFVKSKLDELGINYDAEILVKRIISEDGRSKCFINENLVTSSTLKLLFSDIIEIHSQFSEQGLLDTSTHINILDDFGTHHKNLQKLNTLWKDLTKAKKEVENLNEGKQDQQRIKENIKYDLEELKNLNPVTNEFKDLLNKKIVLQNSAKITETLNSVTDNFYSETPPGIEVLFSRVLNSLKAIEHLMDDSCKKDIENLNSIFLETKEISNKMNNLMNQDFNINKLEEIEDRIQLYKKISKKHNCKEEDLVSFFEKLNRKLDKVINFDEILIKKEQYYKEIKETYLQIAGDISQSRKNSAKKLDEDINKELPALKLENAKFQTFIEQSEPGNSGMDKVTFKIQTNPKSEMDLIKNISSGGELCRFALAIKVIAQKKNQTVMVFDEVDSGIGGAVSSAVGERLKKLGGSRQVIVVTHSPQVAAHGNNHFVVKKDNKNQDTKINVIKINQDQKIKEVARMLSGKVITEEAIQAAKKLIEN
ncbi:MAG: hypothetical protein CMM92_04255 [Rickettsiales bacterium]|nr:hypothetical protein [Rickettsiales bacterium]RPG13984.1 MAG: DNA repair protein RecN [Pelagibacteraceae bacterium TMED195]|tara:strand:+ start:515 stop:2167 length:1653 start_codon:yes stop_codon:yes gene_type:complete